MVGKREKNIAGYTYLPSTLKFWWGLHSPLAHDIGYYGQIIPRQAASAVIGIF
jgi:hypothetical protein